MNLNIEVMAYDFPGVSDLTNAISHSTSVFVKFLLCVRHWIRLQVVRKVRFSGFPYRAESLSGKMDNSGMTITQGPTCWEVDSIK